MRGRFITLEGGEGAGKSTQARRLAMALRARGLEVLLTREPGGTQGAEAIRDLLLDGRAHLAPLAETLMHFAARADHVAAAIVPALAAGQWVVCDRFTDSTMAYQGYGLGVDQAVIRALAAMIGPTPDLTIVLDVPVAVALARLAGRGSTADRYERLGEAFFARVNAGFRAIAAAEPGRCVVVEATAPEEAIAGTVLAVVEARLGLAQ